MNFPGWNIAYWAWLAIVGVLLIWGLIGLSKTSALQDQSDEWQRHNAEISPRRSLLPARRRAFFLLAAGTALFLGGFL
ncbi:MAG TPA: hypothetical protein VGB79_06350 [Allosphingosinicella sp.]|jgi:hypothetical protein